MLNSSKITIKNFLLIFLVLIIIFSLYYFTNLYSKDKLPSSDKVYSVKEIVDLFKNDSDFLKNNRVRIKAYVVDSTKGTGCSSYMVLSDYEYVDYFKNRYDPKLSVLEQRKSQEMASQAPIIYTGITLDMPKDIFPIESGIYEGYFYDKNLSLKCSGGKNRFIIDKKIQEL